MTDPTETPTIVDRPDENRFVARGAGAEAQLDYHRNGNRFVLLHTEVPEALGGHGLGGRLVRAAVDRAAQDDLTVVPWCPFARQWLREHPDEAARVNVDWESPRPERPTS